MVGILIDYDRIGVPKPIRSVTPFVRKNAEKVPAEPETPGTAAFQMEDMTRSKAECKAPVFKGMIDVKPAVVAAHVSDPLPVFVDVWGVRMPFEIPEIVLLYTLVFVMRRSRGTSGRPRAVGRNESSANARRSATLVGPFLRYGESG